MSGLSMSAPVLRSQFVSTFTSQSALPDVISDISAQRVLCKCSSRPNRGHMASGSESEPILIRFGFRAG